MILFFFESRNIKFLHWYRQQALFQSLSISFSGNQREWNKVFTWLCFLLSKEMTEFKKNFSWFKIDNICNFGQSTRYIFILVTLKRRFNLS